MPLYEYRCADCQNRFEVLQALGDGPQGLSCPTCRGSSIRKLLSTFATSASSGDGVAAESCGAPNCGTGFR